MEAGTDPGVDLQGAIVVPGQLVDLVRVVRARCVSDRLSFGHFIELVAAEVQSHFGVPVFSRTVQDMIGHALTVVEMGGS